jgi:hypothetical protein
VILDRAWSRREGIQAWVRRSFRTVVCFDLDSTLAATLHRAWMVPEITAGRMTWLDYSMACGKDEVLPTVHVLRSLHEQHRIHLVSGRNECARQETEGWLALHSVPYDEMTLRQDNDYIANGPFKVREIKRLQGLGYEVRLFFEDWDKAAEAIRKETGVPVVGVNPFYPPRNENQVLWLG